MDTNENISIGKIIVSYFVSLISFYVIDALCVFAFTLLFVLFTEIPIISSILRFLIWLRRELPDVSILVFSILITIWLVKKIIVFMNKSSSFHQIKVFCGLGITLVIIGLLLIIYNLYRHTGVSVLNNIFYIFSGIYFYSLSKE